MRIRPNRRSQKGFTLLETIIAAAILIIVAAGVLSLFGVALTQNSVQGDHGTRTTEYAQDKMEQLMALSLSDTTSDVTKYPTCLSQFQTCSGTGLSAGGSINPTSPEFGYVDYVDINGNPVASATNAIYIREWLITDDSNSPHQIKTITVMVKKITDVGPITPSTVLVSQKGSL